MPRNFDKTCAVCDKPMWRGATSLPQGQATCRPCRRKLNPPKPAAWVPEWRRCRTCGAEFMQARYGQVYCGRECRPAGGSGRKVATPTERGYGTEHKKLRAKWVKVVAEGNTYCWRCGSWLNPTEPWHLGHDDHDRSVHRGPECVPCNTRAGAIRSNKTRHRQVMVKGCATCGSTFETIYPKQTYCSHECRPRRTKRKRRWSEAVPLLNPCAECGALHDRRSERCGACAVERQRAQTKRAYMSRPPRPPMQRCCSECGAEFATQRTDQDYCTPLCRRRAGRKRYRSTDAGRKQRRAEEARRLRRRRAERAA